MIVDVEYITSHLAMRASFGRSRCSLARLLSPLRFRPLGYALGRGLEVLVWGPLVYMLATPYKFKSGYEARSIKNGQEDRAGRARDESNLQLAFSASLASWMPVIDLSAYVIRCKRD
jgi:hypothetical protein